MQSTLTWWNVALAFCFIALNAGISKIYNLGIGVALVTAAVRCVVQLALVGLLLQSVFESNSPWAVAGIVCMWVSSGLKSPVLIPISAPEPTGRVRNQ